MLPDPYGSFLPALWYHDLRDRLSGKRAAAYARWGWLSPPPGRGKLVWIASGAGHASVRLGAELARAIRSKRLDLRLVFTFEREYPELIAPLAELKQFGCGFAPCDRKRSIARAWQRLQPFGLIFAGNAPRPNLARACFPLPHTLVVGAPASAAQFHPERVYPASAAQAQSWRDAPQAPSADLLTLVTPAQVEPNFKTLVNGAADRHLWWWHGDDPGAARQFASAFRREFPQDVLFVSGVQALAEATLALSQWQRGAIPGGSAVLADDGKWLPAIAACCSAAHLASDDIEMLWQALAGGSAVSCAGTAWLPKRELESAVSALTENPALLRQWHECRDNAIFARNRGDAARRAFWQERRLAGEVSDELLQRVFNWD